MTFTIFHHFTWSLDLGWLAEMQVRTVGWNLACVMLLACETFKPRCVSTASKLSPVAPLSGISHAIVCTVWQPRLVGVIIFQWLKFWRGWKLYILNRYGNYIGNLDEDAAVTYDVFFCEPNQASSFLFGFSWKLGPDTTWIYLILSEILARLRFAQAVARRSDDNCTCLVVDLPRAGLPKRPKRRKLLEDALAIRHSIRRVR